jgi:hypothetical protein
MVHTFVGTIGLLRAVVEVAIVSANLSDLTIYQTSVTST